MQRSLTSIVSIIFALAIIAFYVKPAYSEIKGVQDEIEVYNGATSKLEAYKDDLDAKVRKGKQISPIENDRLDALAPSDTDEVRILIDLKKLAESEGMLFGNINVALGSGGGTSNTESQSSRQFDDGLDPDGFSDPNTDGGLGDETLEPRAPKITEVDFITTDISFDVIGSYEQFRSFLRQLESSLVMLEIVDLKFTSGEGFLQQYSFTLRHHALN